jgi:DNA-binding NtrC family response regulator
MARGGTLVLRGIERLSRTSRVALEHWLVETDGGRTAQVWLVVTTRPASPDVGTESTVPEVRQRLLRRLGDPLVLPPLRERLDELAEIVELMLAEACRREDRARPRVPATFLAACRRHDWPRNLAELRETVHRALARSRRGVLGEVPVGEAGPAVLPYREAERDFELRTLGRALRASGGNALRAAELLDLPISTLRYKLRRLEIDPEEPVT